MGGGAGSQQDLSQTAHSCPTLWGKKVGHRCASVGTGNLGLAQPPVQPLRLLH